MSLQNFRIHKRLALKPEIIEEIYTIISEIDAVKNSLQITKQFLPQTIDRLTRSVIITSTGSSNRIEGNKLTDDQVENLYKNLNVQKFKTRDEQEIVGYLECLELIFNNYNEIHITESFILKLHSDMLMHSKKDMRHKGNYKFSSNRVEAKDYEGNIVGVKDFLHNTANKEEFEGDTERRTAAYIKVREDSSTGSTYKLPLEASYVRSLIFEPTPPYLVKKEIQELIDWYNLADKAKHPLILIANFIFEYLAIHPFQDGNRRTSRLLTNLLLLKHGYLFTQIVSHERIIEENKVDYYKALNKTQGTWKTEFEDIAAWLKFFLQVVKLQSIRALQIFEEDNIEYLLSEKQLELWNWINKENKEFSRKDAVSAMGFPERTIESIIKKLVDLKRLERIGQGKATRYRLK